ncbi:MAG: aldo/keto reductase [Spirochaetia bacterium]|nr:aldo/keto reductase [Spirochaetia bacterium]
MLEKNIVEQVCFDQTIEAIDPSAVHTVTLASGNIMPVAAFGTFHSDWAQDYMFDATLEAIRIGWRHIDTARAYENEDIVGQAIAEALKRGYIESVDELFITAKLWNGHMAKASVAPALESTLRALGVEKVDLYLNHWPSPNVHTPGCAADHLNPNAVPYIHEEFMETWQEIVKLKKAGKIVDIGTSNHTKGTMQMLLRDCAADERPVVNQMEMHPLFQQNELRRYFQSEHITCVGYMAMGSPHRPARDSFKEHRNDMADPTLLAIARELGVVPPTVCLSWAVQREQKSGGFVAMATRSDWIRSNLENATRDLLSSDQLIRLCGDGTPGNDGIDANNRLIWGQVFLWPEAEGDWRVLWNDSQLFETREDYLEFKRAWSRYADIKKARTFQSE